MEVTKMKEEQHQQQQYAGKVAFDRWLKVTIISVQHIQYQVK